MLTGTDGILRTPVEAMLGEMVPLSYADTYQACNGFGEEVKKGIKAGWGPEFKCIEDQLKVRMGLSLAAYVWSSSSVVFSLSEHQCPWQSGSLQSCMFACLERLLP